MIGLSIFILLFVFSLEVALFLFLRKKSVKIFYLIGCHCLTGMIPLLFVGIFFFSEIKPVHSTNLNKIDIDGYSIYQTLTQKEFQQLTFLNGYDDGGAEEAFEVTAKPAIFLRILKRSQKISVIGKNNDGQREEAFLGLVLGKSTFEEVVERLGGNYNKIRFPVDAQEEIVYVDKKLKIKLSCYFDLQILEGVTLESY